MVVRVQKVKYRRPLAPNGAMFRKGRISANVDVFCPNVVVSHTLSFF